jgi:Helicase associated domain/Helicase conserved C-terminal domain
MSQLHRGSTIPAARRLYMTATPRIWQPRPPSWEVREGVRDALPEELAASMDDRGIFGPVVYRLTLAQAVSLGLLARYQIIVAEITDAQVTPERLKGEDAREEEVRGLRLGALQAAMMRTATEHRLKTMITFHHRTIEAQAFAEGLSSVAKRLHASAPEQYPARVWSGWLCGEHEAEHRRSVLADFGSRAGLAILCNCKVLGEGVDIRAVDSVAFLDPKGSAVEIVQGIGRALRQKPGEGKLASLIVPVFLEDGERPEDMFTSSSYRPLIQVLQGLRAHDEQAVELLAIPQEKGEPLDPSRDIGPAPEEGEEESRMLLRFSEPRDPSMVAEWVEFNVIDVERQDWARGYAAAKRYFLREKNLRVPFGEKEGAYPLGQWIHNQRKAYANGVMSGERVRRLERLGMIWSEADLAWEENVAAARAYFEVHATLAAPRPASALGRPVGQWLTNCRRVGGLGADPERAQARAAQLASIDPDWNTRELGWSVDWQRHYAGLRVLVESGATLAEVLPGVTYDGEDIGRWLGRQRTAWADLSDGQRERLAQLGVEPAAVAVELPQAAQPEPQGQAAVEGARRLELPTAAAAVPSGAFERGLVAMEQFRAREGHLRVPRGHVEVLADGSEVRLGVFMSNTKARRAKLTPARLAALAAAGLDWAQ